MVDHGVLDISKRVRVLPVVHGSGDFAQEVRRVLLSERFDCVAVPLPPSFKRPLEEAIGALPHVGLVAMREGFTISPDGLEDLIIAVEEEDSEGLPREAPDDDDDEIVEVEGIEVASYVATDPCQAVITALRVALEERMHRAFIDLEVGHYEPDPTLSPDPYALKKVPLERFAATMLPFLEAPRPGTQRDQRIRWMAYQLHRLELDYESILAVVAIQDWPWIRDAYQRRAPYPEPATAPERPQTYALHPSSLYFALGELPYVTHLYESRRRAFRPDDHLSIDGVKELLIEARNRWVQDRGPDQNWITPQLLSTMLQYMRNLTLLDKRLTPDLYTIATAAKQVAGDEFATFVVEAARDYPPQERGGELDTAIMSPDFAELGDRGIFWMEARLPGPPRLWRSLQLKPKPQPHRSRLWSMLWDPYGQCSWPPEDDRIESFNTHVREQARAVLGSDLARTEKFTSSIKDGLDMRETLRNWHTGDLYVREIPPSRGGVEMVVFLFDSPPDPDLYSWRSTWHAEHGGESTLAFYATPFIERMVGPGVGLSKYGGASFLYPPRYVPDIWTDDRLDFAGRNLEDRLISAALFHSRERHVALVAPKPPRGPWRLLARRLRRRIVYIPLGRFSGQTIERLRHFHVLNGHEVRSYASRFIREF